MSIGKGAAPGDLPLVKRRILTEAIAVRVRPQECAAHRGNSNIMRVTTVADGPPRLFS
jgi:hypothetical protein